MRDDDFDAAYDHAEKATDALSPGRMVTAETAIVHSNLAVFRMLALFAEQNRNNLIDIINLLTDLNENVAALRDITTSVEENVDGIDSALKSGPDDTEPEDKEPT